MIIKEVAQYLKEDLNEVERILNENLHSTIKVIPELSTYILESGGKRFRPMLALLSAKMCGYHGVEAAVAGAVIEYIHTATLLHDDVVDESDTRRGRKAAHKIWGNQASILVGDFLFARSFWLMTENLPPEALGVMSDACVNLAEGEILQLIKSFDINTTEEDYYNIIYGKTAALISAACEVGAILGNGDREALRRYGTEIGYAFQISDDLLDIVGDPEKTGKPVGNDFKEGKVTLPLIFALKRASREEYKHIRDLLLAEELEDGAFQYVKEVILKYQGVEEAINRVKDHGKRALEALRSFDNSKEKEFLIGIAEYLAERDY
ncbi:octaprenyl-diphosphate synthase [Thermosulfidibacter takaii ABI70S6]|uniref:Octaprenyl-diphosphate synthase n=1 Tax=Thermosulfidibacter takaii (strain DSM 17441 / JCM 13301 / NBRC 103674 / ABI70S6) TaxID=1298851 RepID=A0A0S3QT13_THET7|nr:polyprenyl synthetase family protein [Thermosulfidibacter takaii]BAT71478.1 octaprenyl-diphosphate synthase [Thermosulfidibacter takaii ABI70S6]